MSIEFEIERARYPLEKGHARLLAEDLRRLHLDEEDDNRPGSSTSAGVAILAVLDEEASDPVRLTDQELDQLMRPLEISMAQSRPPPEDGLALLNAIRRFFDEPEFNQRAPHESPSGS